MTELINPQWSVKYIQLELPIGRISLWIKLLNSEHEAVCDSSLLNVDVELFATFDVILTWLSWAINYDASWVK